MHGVISVLKFNDNDICVGELEMWTDYSYSYVPMHVDV